MQKPLPNPDNNLPSNTVDINITPAQPTSDQPPPKTPKPRTPAQIEAARENAQKSTGPKTPEGKAASSKNALKHGFSSRQPRILPPDLNQEVLAEVEHYTRVHKPQNHVQQRLVEVAAIAMARHHRLTTADHHIAQHLVDSANKKHREDRKKLMHRLARELTDPNNADPLKTLLELQETSHGSRLLASRYDNLASALEQNLAVTPAVKDLLLRFAELDSLRVSPADPAPTQNRARAIGALFHKDNPDFPSLFLGPQQLPNPDEARHFLVDWMRSRARALRACARRLWRTVDRKARDHSHMRDIHDASPEGKLLKRYIVESLRIESKAIEQLKKLQKTPNNLPPVNEPSDPQPKISSHVPSNPPWPPQPPTASHYPQSSAHIKNHPPNAP